MNRRRHLRHCISFLAIAAIFIPVACRAQDQDLSANYTWAPVQIGAGGWMRGMAVSPSDPTRMYARGDVENLYRWNNALQTWVPTKLASAFPSNIAAEPGNAGAGAIAIDPTNPDHILVAYQITTSTDLPGTNSGVEFNLNVYASWDGGVTFTPGNLSLSGNLSSQTSGERLAFDPNNGNVAYFGSPGAPGASDGLYRTTDGGKTWTQVTGGGYLTNTSTVRYESQLPRIDGGNGTVQFSGQTVSSTIYITYITHNESNNDAVSGGGVIKSSDGGQTWTEVPNNPATNICSASQPYSQLCWATMDSAGNLWVTDGNASNNIFKLSRAGTWTTVATPNGGTGGIAVDPNNSNRIFIDAGDVLQRSTNGGTTWTTLGSHYTWSTSQPILWLNPSSFRPQGYFVSESGLYFDSLGNLWQPCGNNGIITTTPNDATDTSSNPPTWTSKAEGIEEMETSAAAIPPGESPVLGVADESEFTIPDPDTYTAEHYPINTWANGGYGLGMSQDIAYAPNAPNFVVAPDTNDETSQGTQPQFQYASYSNDGGNTWTEFPSVVNGTHPCILYGGEIAVSARQSGQGLGADNIVWFPTNAGDPTAQFGQVPAPFYSKDGGTTWTQTQAFNSVTGASKYTECPSNTSYTFLPVQMGDWIYVLAEHQLVADPLTPGTFYLKTTFGPNGGSDGGFWVSTDGGVTWAETAGTTQVPSYTHWGRMAANPNVSGDLWLVDGWQGAHSHGLYHTTNAGASFTRNTAFTYAWQVALGKAASGQTYPAIYVYGLLAGDTNWGIFQSVDGGNAFNRISYYPYGIFDIPYDMAASWDVFGTVYVGFSGNSFYYVQYNANDPQASAPVFFPIGATYQSAQAVTLTSSTPNAAIYYTIDGSTPTTNSNLYGGAITVAAGTETINAITVASGYSPSSVASAGYIVNVTEPQAATPTFSPNGGTFTSAQTVTISDTTSNALIYYTTDGTTPTSGSTQYSSPISVSTTETIQAIAVASGYTNSSIGSAAFTINLPAPSFSLSMTPTALTIQSSSQGTATVTVTPSNGFNSAVSFACSGLPSGVTCSFNPSQVTPAGSAISTQLTVAASSTVAAVHRRSAPFLPEAALAATIFLLGWKRKSLVWAVLFVVLTFAGFAPASGCGGGSSGGQQTQPIQATVTVTATSGALQQTATLALTVN
jgi:hypothetical protein